MALTQISTDGIKNGTITGSDLATNIDLVDNQEIRFGTGSDLKIYHNGSGSYIDDSSGTGELILKSNSISFTNAAENEYLARFFQDSAVQLFFNGSKKFETVANGISIGGRIEFTDTNSIITRPTASALSIETGGSERLRINSSGNVKLPDNGKLQFGGALNSGDGDLQIYHDGSHSYIDESGTGDIKIRSNGNGVILGKTDGENTARFLTDGAVELYYDNSKKFETTSYGAKFTDNVLFNNPDTTGRNLTWEADNDALHWEDNTKATFGAGNDLQIYHDGTDSILYNNTGVLAVRGNDVQLTSKSTEKYFRGVLNGAVELYYDNSKKFETTSTGVTVSGKTTFNDDLNGGDNVVLRLGNATGGDLKIYHDGSHSYIEDAGTGVLHIATSSLQVVNAAKTEFMMNMAQNGAVELYHDGQKKFETTSQGIEVTSNGTVVASTVKSTGSARADMRILAEGTGEAYLWFDASNGDLSGADYAFIQHQNSSLDLIMANYANDVIIKTRNGSIGSGGLNTAIHCTENGEVALYHDGTEKFETTSDGVNLVGNVLKFQGQSNRLIKYRPGDNDMIYEFDSGDFYRQNIGSSRHEFFAGNVYKLGINTSGLLFPNTGTLSQNAMYFETGQNTGDYATMFGVTNYPDASGFGDQNDGHWAKIKSKGGCVVIINSDGGRNDGRNNYDHFSVYHKEGESTNGKRAFSVDHTGGIQCGQAGINIDREWGNQPSFSMTRDCNDGTNNTDDSAYFRFHGTARTHSSWTGGSNGGDFSANMLLDGGNYNASDRRAKTDIVDCPYGLAEVLKLRPRKFQLVNSQLEPQGDDNINLGFIAQELMEILPEPVNYLKNEDVPNEKGFCRAYILDMNEVVPVLTKAIQELAAKVAVLESKI